MAEVSQQSQLSRIQRFKNLLKKLKPDHCKKSRTEKSSSIPVVAQPNLPKITHVINTKVTAEKAERKPKFKLVTNMDKAVNEMGKRITDYSAVKTESSKQISWDGLANTGEGNLEVTVEMKKDIALVLSNLNALNKAYKTTTKETEKTALKTAIETCLNAIANVQLKQQFILALMQFVFNNFAFANFKLQILNTVLDIIKTSNFNLNQTENTKIQAQLIYSLTYGAVISRPKLNARILRAINTTFSSDRNKNIFLNSALLATVTALSKLSPEKKSTLKAHQNLWALKTEADFTYFEKARRPICQTDCKDLRFRIFQTVSQTLTEASFNPDEAYKAESQESTLTADLFNAVNPGKTYAQDCEMGDQYLGSHEEMLQNPTFSAITDRFSTNIANMQITSPDENISFTNYITLITNATMLKPEDKAKYYSQLFTILINANIENFSKFLPALLSIIMSNPNKKELLFHLTPLLIDMLKDKPSELTTLYLTKIFNKNLPDLISALKGITTSTSLTVELKTASLFKAIDIIAQHQDSAYLDTIQFFNLSLCNILDFSISKRDEFSFLLKNTMIGRRKILLDSDVQIKNRRYLFTLNMLHLLTETYPDLPFFKAWYNHLHDEYTDFSQKNASSVTSYSVPDKYTEVALVNFSDNVLTSSIDTKDFEAKLTALQTAKKTQLENALTKFMILAKNCVSEFLKTKDFPTLRVFITNFLAQLDKLPENQQTKAFKGFFENVILQITTSDELSVQEKFILYDAITSSTKDKSYLLESIISTILKTNADYLFNLPLSLSEGNFDLETFSKIFVDVKFSEIAIEEEKKAELTKQIQELVTIINIIKNPKTASENKMKNILKFIMLLQEFSIFNTTDCFLDIFKTNIFELFHIAVTSFSEKYHTSKETALINILGTIVMQAQSQGYLSDFVARFKPALIEIKTDFHKFLPKNQRILQILFNIFQNPATNEADSTVKPLQEYLPDGEQDLPDASILTEFEKILTHTVTRNLSQAQLEILETFSKETINATALSLFLLAQKNLQFPSVGDSSPVESSGPPQLIDYDSELKALTRLAELRRDDAVSYAVLKPHDMALKFYQLKIQLLFKILSDDNLTSTPQSKEQYLKQLFDTTQELITHQSKFFKSKELPAYLEKIIKENLFSLLQESNAELIRDYSSNIFTLLTELNSTFTTEISSEIVYPFLNFACNHIDSLEKSDIIIKYINQLKLIVASSNLSDKNNLIKNLNRYLDSTLKQKLPLLSNNTTKYETALTLIAVLEEDPDTNIENLTMVIDMALNYNSLIPKSTPRPLEEIWLLEQKKEFYKLKKETKIKSGIKLEDIQTKQPQELLEESAKNEASTNFSLANIYFLQYLLTKQSMFLVSAEECLLNALNNKPDQDLLNKIEELMTQIFKEINPAIARIKGRTPTIREKTKGRIVALTTLCSNIMTKYLEDFIDLKFTFADQGVCGTESATIGNSQSSPPISSENITLILKKINESEYVDKSALKEKLIEKTANLCAGSVQTDSQQIIPPSWLITFIDALQPDNIKQPILVNLSKKYSSMLASASTEQKRIQQIIAQILNRDYYSSHQASVASSVGSNDFLQSLLDQRKPLEQSV